ncbi:MAG: pyruvate kinase [Rickettsiales bacterium]|nr:pyruvate kinase [Rickettsiales bacterium]
MQKLTKITASIGPASTDYEILKSMVSSGVNVCRLNFSHDTGAVQGAKFDKIRILSKELGRPIAIIADLQGPKHRIGDFETEDHYPIEPGQTFILDNDPKPGNSARVQLPDEDVLKSLKVGDRVLLNDGKIELEVSQIANHESRITVSTRVARGNEIWSRRGFNLPDTEVDTSVLTEKDRADLEYALTKEPDFIAISFVQKPEDVMEVRDFITARTTAPVKVIVKIERPQAVVRAEEIIDAADAVMVARGDLAVEMPFEQIPAVQRRLIRLCRKKNRPIIVATQMLGSMVHEEFPLRAEISDVATAAYLRADSTMTSEETAIGDYPEMVVETMAKILGAADADSIENSYDWGRVDNVLENDWSRSVASMAYLNKASSIVVFDRDGNATREISCRRPDMPIIAVCNSEIVANQLCLSRGVQSIFDERMFGQRDIGAALAAVGISGGKTVTVDEDSIMLN